MGRAFRAEHHDRSRARGRFAGTPKFFDVHLTIAPVDLFLADSAAAGADLISVQVGPDRICIGPCRRFGSRQKGGRRLNPATPVSAIENVLDLVDLVLVMSVNPGFGGEAFIPQAIEKVAQAKGLIGARPIRIAVMAALIR